MSETVSKSRVVAFVCAIVFFDAVGFGLLMPIMPELLADVAGLSISEGATIAGLLLTTFAIMQFLFAPILGGLSDRFGRRPVLDLQPPTQSSRKIRTTKRYRMPIMQIT